MSKLADLITYASAQLGKPYVYGDEGPNTFDCSGLMQYVFGLVGIKLPRTAAQQQKFATPVKDPQPGDLIFYGAPAHHVALYIGGGRQIAAPHSGATVAVQKVGSDATYGRVSGLGGTAGLIVQNVGDAITTPVSGVLDWIGPARNLTIEAIAVTAGVVLVGIGLWRTVGKRAVTTTLDNSL